MTLDQTWVIKNGHIISFLSVVTNNPQKGDIHHVEGFNAKYEFLIFSNDEIPQKKKTVFLRNHNPKCCLCNCISKWLDFQFLSDYKPEVPSHNPSIWSAWQGFRASV